MSDGEPTVPSPADSGEHAGGKPTGHGGPARGRLRKLLDEVLSAGQDMGLPDVLRRVVTAAAELVDARYGAFGVVDGHGVITQFVPVGLDDEQAARIGRLPTGHGLLGELIRRPEPLRLSEMGEHPSAAGVPAGHPSMHSFLGVPVRVRGEVYGILYLTEKNGRPAFSEDDETLVVLLSVAAGAAVESARRHEQTRLAERWASASGEVASLALSGSTLRRLLDRVAALAREAAAADLGLVLRRDRSSPEAALEIVAAVGADAGRFVGVRLPDDGVFPASTLSTGRAVTVTDLEHAPAARARDSLWGSLGPAVALPLPFAAVGPRDDALVLAWRKPAAVPTGMDRLAWSQFADATAMALELARRREEVGTYEGLPGTEARLVADELRRLAARLSAPDAGPSPGSARPARGPRDGAPEGPR